jgi:hypothetical protein
VKITGVIAKEPVNVGEFLRRSIERMGIKKMAAAAAIGVSDATLRSWFRQRAPAMRPENRVNAAKLLKISPDKLETMIAQAQGETLPTGILGYSETKIPEIPVFEASLAAGPWVDVSEIGEVCDPRLIDHGLFRVRLAGDSMEPTYPDGSLVEFQCLRPDRDGVIVGKSYYVQKSDGTATFKRVSKVNEETFELSAINRKRYPKSMIVERGLVTRIARAVYRLQEAE